MTHFLRTFLQRLLWSSSLSLAAVASAASPAEETRFIDFSDIENVCGVPQIGFYNGLVTLVAGQLQLKNGKTYGPGIFYRRSSNSWEKIPIEAGAHSITGIPGGRWLVNDATRDRLIQLDDLSGRGRTVSRSELAGVEFLIPHDQVVDPNTGYVYMIDTNARLYRFRDLAGPADVWTFTPEEVNYSRALSWFDGHLHVIHSSRGEVIRIDDYETHQYTVFRSPRPQAKRALAVSPYGDFPAGALETTGLVLNDVDKVGGWYYGTNFFDAAHAMGGDTRPGRLIRWRTWADFERGKWEDLSHLLPRACAPFPYFLLVHSGVLYAGLSSTVPAPLGASDSCSCFSIFSLDPRTLHE